MENKRTETNKTVQKRLEPELKLINMDTVEVEQIEWLLYPFIPYGKVTIIQGDPGEGKTTMVLQIIAKLTRGESILPVDSTKDKRTNIDSEGGTVDTENAENNALLQQLEAPVNVIYQTAEDGLGDTIKPRLLAAGADCTKVMVIDDSEQPLTMVLWYTKVVTFRSDKIEENEQGELTMTKKYNEEFKKQMVQEYLKGTSYPKLSKEYHVAKSTLVGWVKKYSEECQLTKPQTSPSFSESAKEIHELQKRIHELEKENLFLKKAAAFFAKEID